MDPSEKFPEKKTCSLKCKKEELAKQAYLAILQVPFWDGENGPFQSLSDLQGSGIKIGHGLNQLVHNVSNAYGLEPRKPLDFWDQLTYLARKWTLNEDVLLSNMVIFQPAMLVY